MSSCNVYSHKVVLTMVECYFCRLMVVYETQQDVILKILPPTMGLVEAVCFSSPSVRLHIVMTRKTTVLIFSTVKTSNLNKCVCVADIVGDIFGCRNLTMVGLRCNSLSSSVYVYVKVSAYCCCLACCMHWGSVL